MESRKRQKLQTNPKVDWFFNKTQQWQEEYRQLRAIVLACDLVEELKWGHPCYMHAGRNIRGEKPVREIAGHSSASAVPTDV